MEVILLTDCEKLGNAGDVVKIKDGYARNFLIPRKMAIPSTKENLHIAEAQKKMYAARIEKEKEKYVQLAEKIAALSCTIRVRVGEEEKLFGAVTNTDIHNSLVAEGIDIDKRKIEISEPIKKLGVYSITIRLHPAVNASLKVWVVKE
jgi:large subunit ribosomal protein L9